MTIVSRACKNGKFNHVESDRVESAQFEKGIVEFDWNLLKTDVWSFVQERRRLRYAKRKHPSNVSLEDD